MAAAPTNALIVRFRTVGDIRTGSSMYMNSLLLHYVMITYQFCCDLFLFLKLILVQLPQYMKLGLLQNNMIICELRWN